MSSIPAVRDAFKATLETNISGLRCYDTVPEVTNVPAVIVEPASADFNAFNGSCSKWEFDLYVLVSRVDAPRGQDALDAYIGGSGSSSIRKVVKDNPTLGLADVDATVESMRAYGGSFDSMGVKYIGAILRACVYITE